MEIKKLITIKDLAEMYGVHPSFFRKRIKDGTLKALRIGGVTKYTRGKDGIERKIMQGGTWRIEKAEVERYFESILLTSTAVRADDVRPAISESVPTADPRTNEAFVESIRPHKGGYIDNIKGVVEAIKAGILVDIKTASAVAGISTTIVKEWVYLDLIDVFYTHKSGRKSYFIRTDCNVKKVESEAPIIAPIEFGDDIRKQVEAGALVTVFDLAKMYVIKERNLIKLCKYGRVKSYITSGAPSYGYFVDLDSFKEFALKKNIKPRV